MEYINILNSKENFPCKISDKEGEILKENFIKDLKFEDNHKDKKDIEFRYFKDLDGEKYILIEEYLFRDNENNFDLNRLIGKNYYLSKK